MSQAKDSLRLQIADMIENLESQIRFDKGVIDAAEDARDQLIALDAFEDDILPFIQIVEWTTAHLESVNSLLESAKKIQEVI